MIIMFDEISNEVMYAGVKSIFPPNLVIDSADFEYQYEMS